jgi:hypothetical protein
MTALLNPTRFWECPHCRYTDVTHEARPHTRFHSCTGMHGLTAPMVEAGSKVKITLKEREDYVGDETVTMAGGRPVMSIVTEREDGSNDVVVFAPTATAKAEDM